MARPEAEEAEKPKDRKLLALLALAVLLVGLAVGVELCRRLFPGGRPKTLAGDYDFKPPPPPLPTPSPQPEQAAPAAGVLTARQFLTIVARRTPLPVARKFMASVKSKPQLRRVFAEATKSGLDKTPARRLLSALMATPEFREVIVASRSDPGFRETFAQLARDPEVGGTIQSGTVAMVRPPAGGGSAPERSGTGLRGGLGAQDGGPGGPADSPSGEGGDAGGPSETPPETPEEGPPQSTDGPPAAAGQEAHNVSRQLGKVNAAGPSKEASVSFFRSIATYLSREQRKRLDENCDPTTEYGCAPLLVCHNAGLVNECRTACRALRNCPPEFDTED